jgi:hypothetical protein
MPIAFVKKIRSGAAFTALIGVIAVIAASPSPAATPDQAPPVAPGRARVWFLRQLFPGSAMFAPMVSANGAPVGISPQGTVFYRDFPPGNYVFTVENCIPEPRTSFALPLAPGNQFALEVQSDPNGAWDCEDSQISYLRPVPPELLSQAFAPLAYLGQR